MLCYSKSKNFKMAQLQMNVRTELVSVTLKYSYKPVHVQVSQFIFSLKLGKRM